MGVTGHKCWQALDRVPLAQPGRVDYILKLKAGLAAASALGRAEKQADGGGIGLGLGGGQRCPESRGLALGTGRQKVRFAPGQRSHTGGLAAVPGRGNLRMDGPGHSVPPPPVLLGCFQCAFLLFCLLACDTG